MRGARGRFGKIAVENLSRELERAPAYPRSAKPSPPWDEVERSPPTSAPACTASDGDTRIAARARETTNKSFLRGIAGPTGLLSRPFGTGVPGRRDNGGSHSMNARRRSERRETVSR